MKTSQLLTGLLSSGVLAATASAAFVTGQSIDFLESDFSEAGAAQKSWALYTTATDTPVWQVTGMSLQPSNQYYAVVTSATAPTASLTWRVEVPESVVITGFTWAVRELFLAGAKNSTGDDTFAFEYSLDNTNWTTLASYDNRGASSANLTVSNLVLPVSSVGGTSHELYVRAAHFEGSSISGDGGFFAIASTVAAGGGTNPNSYIALQVAPIPEPASAGIVAAASAAVFAFTRRTRRTRLTRGACNGK